MAFVFFILLAFLQSLEAYNVEFNISRNWNTPEYVRIENDPMRIVITKIRKLEDVTIAEVIVRFTPTPTPTFTTSTTTSTSSWSEGSTDDGTTTGVPTDPTTTMFSTPTTESTPESTEKWVTLDWNVTSSGVFLVNFTSGIYYGNEYRSNLSMSTVGDTNVTEKQYQIYVTYYDYGFGVTEMISLVLEDADPTTTTTTRRPLDACDRNCTAIEEKENGRLWNVCAGQTDTKPCSETQTNATGRVTWKCSEEGYKFETERPNYSNCSSSWRDELEEVFENVVDLDTALDFLDNVTDVITTPEGSNSNIFGSEIPLILSWMGTAVKTASDNTTSSERYREVAEKTAKIAGGLVTDLEPWLELSLTKRSETATPLIGLMENTSLFLSSKADVTGRTRRFEQRLTWGHLSLDFFVESLAYSKLDEKLDEVNFPRTSGGSHSIYMPQGWANLVPGDRVDVVVIRLGSKYTNTIFQQPFRLGQGTNEKLRKIINGDLLSITIGTVDDVNRSASGIEIEFPSEGVQIVFKHDLNAWGEKAYDVPRDLLANEHPKVAKGTAKCMFWNTEFDMWSSKGCRVVSSSEQETRCECDHLTSFAILMDIHNYVGKDPGLEVLTLVLCPLSLICLISTVFVLATVRAIKSHKTRITLQLSLCLLAGEVLLLLLSDRSYLNSNEGVCIASGIITHYVFLAAFGWMAIEGVHFYHSVVTVFEYSSSPTKKFLLFAYVSPVVLIAITLGIGYGSGDKPYGGELFCWLQGSYGWAFLAPVLLVIVVNSIIIILWKIKEDLGNNQRVPSTLSRLTNLQIRCRLKGCLMLTALMGLAWIVGFFLFIPDIPSLVFSYLFTIFNASQGIFLFVSNCVLQEEARQGFHKQYGKWYMGLLKKSATSTNKSKDEPEAVSNGVIFHLPRIVLSNSYPQVNDKPKIVLGGLDMEGFESTC